MSEDDDGNLIILEGTGWKRRSGFAKYAYTVAGASWERRRFQLVRTSDPKRKNQLKYYNNTCSSDKNTFGSSASDKNTFGSSAKTNNTPRGTLDIQSESATVVATYPADPSQPTPYALSISPSDAADKWKFCFDDRETQLIWLVALADVIAEGNVQEYTLGLKDSLRDELDTGAEQDRGRLLDLVRIALWSSDNSNKTIQHVAQPQEIQTNAQKNTQINGQGEVHNTGQEHIAEAEEETHKKAEEAETEAIEVVKRSIVRSFSRSLLGVSIRMFCSPIESDTTSPSKSSPEVTAVSKKSCLDDQSWKNSELPDVKLYQSLLVFLVSFVFERCAGFSNYPSSLLWQFAIAVILFICFHPKKRNDGDEAPPLNNNKEASVTAQMNSVVGTELIKAEGVPLCPSSITSKPRTKGAADGDGVKQAPTHRLEPLTEEEMKSNLHQRWAMSAPDVNLSGQVKTNFSNFHVHTLKSSLYQRQLFIFIVDAHRRPRLQNGVQRVPQTAGFQRHDAQGRVLAYRPDNRDDRAIRQWQGALPEGDKSKGSVGENADSERLSGFRYNAGAEGGRRLFTLKKNNQDGRF